MGEQRDFHRKNSELGRCLGPPADCGNVYRDGKIINYRSPLLCSHHCRMCAQLMNWAVTGVITYYLGSFIQTLFHRIFGHTRRIEAIYDTHVCGHHANYQAKLLTEQWVPSERHVMWYYAIPFAPVWIAALVLLPRALF